MLRELELRINQAEQTELLKLYDLRAFLSIGITKLFRRNLKSLRSIKFVKIAIYLTGNKSIDGNHEIFGNQIDVYKYSEFEKIYDESLESHLRKEYLLTLIKDSLLANTVLLDMDPFDINEAYQECLKRKILYEYYYKNKLYRSSSRKYYFGLLTIQDVDKYEIWEVLFNSKKEELARRICYHAWTDFYFLESASWKKDKDVFSYKFDTVKNEFCSNIEDILSGKQTEAYSNRDKYFKY